MMLNPLKLSVPHAARICQVLGAVLLLAVASSMAFAVEPAPPKKPKEPLQFAQIEKAVQGYLQGRPNYKPGDMILRSDVKQILARVAEVGWKPAKPEELLDAAIGDEAFLATQIKSPA